MLMNRAGKIPLVAMALALLACPLAGQPRPREFGEGPYRWKPVDLVLDERGSPLQDLRWDTREALNWQIAGFRAKYGSASDLGLEEGAVPSEEMCGASYPRPRLLRMPGYGNLDLTLMLSEVAVVATLGEMIMGFYGAVPTALVSLEEVVPLHGYSPTPDHVLVPLGRLVARDAVFCSWIDGKRGFNGKVGDRILLLGPWDRGVVDVGSEGASLAAVSGGMSVDWWFGLQDHTFQQVEEAAERVTLTGLHEYATEARRADATTVEGAAARDALGREVEEATDGGCVLAGLEETADGWALARVCEQ